MKPKFLFAFFLSCLYFSAYAQIIKPAKWSYSTSKKEVKAGAEVDLVFTVTIDKDWYVYSSDFDPDLGPQVTEFTFKSNDTYQLVGKIKPINPKKKYSDVFEGDYTYFTGKGEFRQTVRILKTNPKITGSYTYQACSDVTGQCIPFDDDFTFDQIKLLAQNTETAPINQANEQTGATPSKPQASADTTTQPANPVETTVAGNVPNKDSAQAATTPGLTESNGNDENAQVAALPGNETSLLTLIIGAFLAGLAALLTPCVYPMVPMTVTFFTRQSASRTEGISKALFYGFSIIAIYTLIGVVFSVIFGPAFPNFLSTHWLPNLIFFLIFVLFGLSFLGLFDINIPGSVITKVDAQADKGGFAGIFFMAFTIVLVSFSCTAPIASTILLQSAGGQIIKPVVGMIAYSSAFALPFTLFAIFPQWLSSLPKSGGWLNAVKVVLGFLELALALKFLSIADQVYHWGILDRDIFLAFWIVIFALIGFYLLGKIRMPSDDTLDKISVPRMMLAIGTFTFVVYLIPGLFGAPLKPLAGYLPPQTTQDFDLNKPNGLLVSDQQAFTEKPKYAEFLKLPHGLNGFFDYKQGLAYAKKVNKPVFIDFTGHGCVNCREMEARVWSDPQVLQRLANDYVVIALYVDDKSELPESEWYTSTYDKKVKQTIGAQNADLQINRFGYNAQPFYVLLNTKGEQLDVAPKAYDLNANNFAAFLDKGTEQFKLGKTANVAVSLTSKLP